MLKSSLLLSLAVGVTACVPKKPGANVTKNQSAEVPVALGLGYDTEAMRNKDQCIKFKEQDLGGSGVNMTFERVESLESKLASLGFSSSIALSYSIATGKASADFTTSLRESAYTATYLLDFSAMKGSFHAVGVEPLMKADNPFEFRKKCGDRYVSEVTKGGRLLAGVTFMFADKESKEAFNSKFSLGVDTITVKAQAEASVSRALDIASEKTTIKISFNQKGGDASELKKSFAKGEDVMVCDLKNRDECKRIISALFNYAINVFPDSLRDSSYVYSFSTEDYPDVPRLTDLGDETVRANKKETAAALEKATNDRQVIRDLLATPSGYGTDARRDELRNVLNGINVNHRALSSNLKNCIDGDGTCVSVAELKLKAFDDENYFKPAGELMKAGSIGGLGGGEVAQICNDYLIGLHGQSGKILDTAGAWCSNGEKKSQLGTRKASPFETRCPSNMVVVGIKGTREDFERKTAVGSLSLLCATKEDVKARKTDVQKVPVFSEGEQGQALEYRCFEGQAAKGILFRAGELIDAIELQCIAVL